MRAVINGCGFPVGVGENAKEAKQNAAQIALTHLNDKENQIPVLKNKDPNVQPYKKNFRTRLHDNVPACKPTGVSCTVATEDGALAEPPTPQTAPDPCDASAMPVAKACNSSKNPKVMQCPEEKNSLSTPSEMTSGNSEIFSHSGFDCTKRIGKGSFGQVFKARDKLVGNNYAIKITPCKEKAMREATALSVLNHVNIIRYYGCWIGKSGCLLDGFDSSCSTMQSSSDHQRRPSETSIRHPSETSLFILMELGDTKTLRDWIDEKNMEKACSDMTRRKQSLTIAKQVVSGVEHIHFKNLIHRDLKPSNILFGLDGTVKIGDFGLVTADNADDDKSPIKRTSNTGSPNYMAPEQECEKTYDRKVDIYAVGLIYFELLWMIPTCHERSLIWDDVRRQKLPREFVCSFTLEYNIIRSMLSVKPEKRPEACKVATDLEECIHKLNAKETVRHRAFTV